MSETNEDPSLEIRGHTCNYCQDAARPGYGVTSKTVPQPYSQFADKPP